MKPASRAAITAATMVIAASAAIGVHDLRMAGLFAHVTPGFAGTCKPVQGIAGAGDIAIDAADDLVFIAASDPRGSNGRDGIYTMTLAGESLARLAGAPGDFHPHAISLIRAPDGALTLMAVNDRARGKPAIDIFGVTVANGVARLVQQSEVEGGLILRPSAIAAVGPNSFYVANESTGKTATARLLERYAMLPRGDIVYFNGMEMREVVTGLGQPDGIALTPDGRHLIVASADARALVTFESDMFFGGLKQVGTLLMPAAPAHLTLDASGNLWAAGHADLFARAAYARDPARPAPSQIFKLAMKDGVPQSAVQVYGNGGGEIGAANVGAVANDRLVIGSALDRKILDCLMR